MGDMADEHLERLHAPCPDCWCYHKFDDDDCEETMEECEWCGQLYPHVEGEDSCCDCQKNIRIDK